MKKWKETCLQLHCSMVLPSAHLFCTHLYANATKDLAHESWTGRSEGIMHRSDSIPWPSPPVSEVLLPVFQFLSLLHKAKAPWACLGEEGKLLSCLGFRCETSCWMKGEKQCITGEKGRGSSVRVEVWKRRGEQSSCFGWRGRGTGGVLSAARSHWQEPGLR